MPPERRAKIEAEFGAPLPFFREGLCEQCWKEWFREWCKTPESKVEMERVKNVMMEKWRRDLRRWEQDVRSAALKALDVADAIAGKL